MNLPATAVGIAHVRKEVPDEIDLTVMRLLAAGRSFNFIGRSLGIAKQTAEGRVRKLQAGRWVTFDGRVLRPEERERMLEWERDQFPKMAIFMEDLQCSC